MPQLQLGLQNTFHLIFTCIFFSEAQSTQEAGCDAQRDASKWDPSKEKFAHVASRVLCGLGLKCKRIKHDSKFLFHGARASRPTVFTLTKVTAPAPQATRRLCSVICTQRAIQTNFSAETSGHLSIDTQQNSHAKSTPLLLMLKFWS